MLFSCNDTEKHKKIKISNNHCAECYVGNSAGLWTGIEIRKIIVFVNQLLRQFPNVKVPVHFYFEGNTFIDKLTYVFIECICYYLVAKGHYVQIYLNVKPSIGIEGIASSPLLLLNNTKISSVKKYPVKFAKDAYLKHYRRIVDARNVSSNVTGDIYTEIDSCLKVFDLQDEFIDKVALTISELVGNAIEHAKTDCLIDVDVTTPYRKEGEENIRSYYGVNIVVLNFSPKLLGDDLKEKVIYAEDVTGRYSNVKEAYDFHSNYFSESYLEDDFCNISAFQHKISGRKDIANGVGGTGLTTLIKSLEKMSDNYRCYVITGSRCINFDHQFLEYNQDGWLGFNDNNDYFTSVPDSQLINECLIYMPGTAYNLNFVMKGEKIDGD